MRTACTTKEALDAGGYWKLDWYGPKPPYGSWGNGIWRGHLAFVQAESPDEAITLAGEIASYWGRLPAGLWRFPDETIIASKILPGSRIGCEFVGEQIDVTDRARCFFGPPAPSHF